MKRIDVGFARKLIDFSGAARNGTGALRRGIPASFAKSQLQGAVASYNMLAENRVAYIADEVGMGKTYVALGVMGLVRHFSPGARMLVVAPRANIQLKWVKELRNFIRNNWRLTDNRVKSIQGTPAREPTICHSLAEFAHELTTSADRDFFLRMTSFSLALKHVELRDRYKRQILRHVDWLPDAALSSRTEREFREQYGRALNALLPAIDLLVVDEAHNLRKGFGSPDQWNVSNRNRILGLTLGHPSAAGPDRPWYRPRVKHVLCLSATPFEDDYADIWRQLDVLGAGGIEVSSPRGGRVFPVRSLAEAGTDEKTKRKLVSNLLIRRITQLEIGGKKHTKNMYRREWRYGGFQCFDEPISFDDPRQRLIVGLIQKKVAEVLGNERFGNRFQIGMLSSFESFVQTVGHIKLQQKEAHAKEGNESDAEREEATFDGRQTQMWEEQRGADTRVLNTLVESYRNQFGHGLPHPKLDATVQSLASAFETGEKALIFVRRVATVRELSWRLDRQFDKWIRHKMKAALPELSDEIDQLFERFTSENGAGASPESTTSRLADSAEQGGELWTGVDGDPGGRENFFSWFFRGKGPEGVLSGGRFQRNRLSNTAAFYSTLFEDDLIAWLLHRPDRPLADLAEQLGLSPEQLNTRLRGLAWAYYRSRTRQHAGYPRYYVFEAYQSAGLHLLAKSGGEVANRAGEVLKGRFPDHHGGSLDPPKGFPPPKNAIGIATFFTELIKHPELRKAIWPDEKAATFAERFRRREERRELVSAMSRLGAAYIDLYLLAIYEAGSFRVGRAAGGDAADRSLARRFVELLAEQRNRPGFHAFAELNGASGAFDTLIGVNFPDVSGCSLTELAEIFGRSLQHQNPVGRMSGRVAGRTVQQFRMPGFPLFLISTDVLQEGEDLHTFCRKVIHYGITWTPSAMEQRTGRVDRIDSLLQRQLDGRERAAEPEEKIQVHFPHLEDTVERLQVRRVLRRLDRFLRLIHEPVKRTRYDRRIDKNREILTSMDLPAPMSGPLKPAFPVSPEWLEGAASGSGLRQVDVGGLTSLLDCYWERLIGDLGIELSRQQRQLDREGLVRVSAGGVVDAQAARAPVGSGRGKLRRQLVRLELRSAGIDGVTFLRCSSEIGLVDLSHVDTIDLVQQLALQLGQPRLCARYQTRHGKHALSVEASLPFDRATTQYEEFRELFSRVAHQADRLEHELLGVDLEPLQRREASDRA